MKLTDLPRVDDAVVGQMGIVVKTSPGKAAGLPWWEGRGNGTVQVVTYRGNPYIVTRLTPEWAVLINVDLNGWLEEETG